VGRAAGDRSKFLGEYVMATKAKAKRGPEYAAADGPELIRLMVRAGCGEVKLAVARDAAYRVAVGEERVAAVEDILEALRSDSRVFPGALEKIERLAEVGTEYWDDQGNVIEEKPRRMPEIEDVLSGKDVKGAIKRMKARAGDFDPTDEPGGLDRLDSPTFHAEDADAAGTAKVIGDSVSWEEAEERADAARLEAAKPSTTPATGPGPTPATTSPKIVPPGTGQGSQQQEAEREAARQRGNNPPPDEKAGGKSKK
jgi:hypothetical protein